MATRKSSVVLELDNRIGGPLRRMNRQIEHATRNARRRFAMMTRAAARVGAGITALAATAGGAIFKITQGYADSTREIDTFSKRLGMSTQALSGWIGVGRRFAVEQEAITDGFKELQIRADEYATQGVGGGAEAFQRLGLTREQIADVSNDTEALIDLVMSRIRRVGDFAAKQRILDEVFGGQGGEQFVEMASQPAAVIEQIVKDVRQAGGIIGPEQTKSARRYTDALQRLKGQFVGIRNIVGHELAPVLTRLFNDLRQYLQDNQERIKRWAEQFGKDLPRRLRELRDSVLEIARVIQGVVSFVGGWRNALVGVAALSFAPLAASVWTVGTAIVGISKFAVEATRKLYGMAQAGKAASAAGAAAGATPDLTSDTKQRKPSRLLKYGKYAAAGLGSVVTSPVAIAGAALGAGAYGVYQLQESLQGEKEPGRARNKRRRAPNASTVQPDKVDTPTESVSSRARNRRRRSQIENTVARSAGESRNRERPPSKPEQVRGEIQVRIDSEGRARVRSVESRGPLDLDVYSGPLLLGS